MTAQTFQDYENPLHKLYKDVAALLAKYGPATDNYFKENLADFF
ncbi:hypothetical protein [Oenococcus sicerae]|nr:hypothetical protein [Oenococcus sicerae]